MLTVTAKKTSEIAEFSTKLMSIRRGAERLQRSENKLNQVSSPGATFQNFAFQLAF
jgi:hypothetical protein